MYFVLVSLRTYFYPKRQDTMARLLKWQPQTTDFCVPWSLPTPDAGAEEVYGVL